jgi:multidrug efflux pump subunit AcrA (membrane-fusion protein)
MNTPFGPRFIVLVWVAAQLGACGLFASQEQAAPTEAVTSNPLVATELQAGGGTRDWVTPTWQDTVEVGEVPARILAAPGSHVEVRAPSPGRLLSLSVTPGDKVEPGTELARLICPELALADAAARTARERIEALSNRRAHLEQLRSEGLTKAADLVQLDLEITLARGEQARSQAILAAAGTKPVRPDGLVVLRSTLAGIVTRTALATGVYLRPEDGAIVAISKAEGTRVEAILPTTHLETVSAVLRAAGQADRPLTFISHASVEHPGVPSLLAWYEITDGQAVALSRPVKVRLSTNSRTRCVPTRAVVSRGGETAVVWRVAQGSAQRSPIRVVTARDNQVCFDGELPPEAEVSLRPELLEATDGH